MRSALNQVETAPGCETSRAEGRWPQCLTRLLGYHDFADRSVLFGVPHAGDVLSNVGFAILGIWGLIRLWPVRRNAAIAAGWPGYSVFLLALVLTAAGSSVYHLSPNNARLVWDRVPLALACAGLLAAVRAESRAGVDGRLMTGVLAIAALMSVWWWRITDAAGEGDLRPYLLIQALPLVLIPLWQVAYRRPRNERIAFGAAILLYIAAKIAELNDHSLYSILAPISGHTIKHLLATVASVAIVRDLIRRVPRCACRVRLHA
jgi:hypothetical protein